MRTPATELYYGGAAGGGKTDLLLGAPISEKGHRQSIIFRREYPQLKGIIARSRELYRRYGSYNGAEKLWSLTELPHAPLIEFGAVDQDSDLDKYQGRAHDLKAFDELPQFPREHYIFLTGWLRSGVIGQRQRVIGAGNPPLTVDGEWVVDYWAPWLSDQHPNPAMPGELRWFVMLDNKDTEVPDGEPFLHKGERLVPISRTFIPARIEDNPILMATNYRSRLQAFPEPLRSQLLEGKFNVTRTVPNRVYYNYSKDNLSAAIPYEPERVLYIALDFNVQPAVMLFAHELVYGEYPIEHHEQGVPQLGIFGELYLEEDYDATKLTLLAVRGKDRNDQRPEGFRLPDNFRGLIGHRNRLFVYGDPSGAQKRVESEDNRTAWMYVTSVLNANMPGAYTLQVPDAAPSVIHSAGVLNYKLRGLNGKVSVWIHPRCRGLIRDFEQVTWANDKKGNLEIDKSNRLLTHSSDALRYLVMARYKNNMKGTKGSIPTNQPWFNSLNDNLSGLKGLVGPNGQLPWEK